MPERLFVPGLGLICLLSAPLPLAADVINGDFEVPPLAMNSGPTYYPNNTPADFGWQVVSGSIDHVRDGFWNGARGNADTFIDMDGLSAGAIAQQVYLEAGVHVLDFVLAGNPAHQGWTGLSISVGNLASDFYFYFNAEGNTHHSLDWVLATAGFSVSSAGWYTLQFGSLDIPISSWGPLLDHVAIDNLPSDLALFPQYQAPAIVPDASELGNTETYRGGTPEPPYPPDMFVPDPNPSSVPDAGSTLVLLGLASAALGLVRLRRDSRSLKTRS